MNAVRYYFALILAVGLPPLLLIWLLIHPFVRFWRRVGVAAAYSGVGGVTALVACGLFLVRERLLRTEFGANYFLGALGAICLFAAVCLRIRLQQHLKLQVRLGLPELAPDRHPGRLLTEGVYARIRHPRYVQLLLAMLGYALVANHLAAYLAVALWVPGGYVIVLLEEKELPQRFGAAYEDNCRRVPRFVPQRRLVR